MVSHLRKVYHIRLLTDFLCLIFCYLVSEMLSGRIISNKDIFSIVLLLATWYFSSKYTELYDEFRTVKYIDEFLVLVPNVLIQGVVLMLYLFILNDQNFPRRFVFWDVPLVLAIMSLQKYLFKKINLMLYQKGYKTKNILIIGTGDSAMAFHKLVTDAPHFGYKVMGFVDEVKPAFLNGQYKGSLADLEAILTKFVVQEVIVALPVYNQEYINKVILATEREGIKTRIVPEFTQYGIKQYKMELFGGSPILTVRRNPLEDWHLRVVKRAFDVVFSLAVIVLIFSWLLPIIAILIKLDSKGPIFFLQERWGKNNQKITCFKFRSMYSDSSTRKKDGGFWQTEKDDPRITKMGKFLRKTNLDELPQFFNVLMGDMSVVGPRPHAVQHNIESKDQIDNYLLRHWVKPGITGWAQVNGFRGETKELSLMKKRVEFDIWYIEHWSIWLDVKIVIATAYNMVKGEMMAY